MPLFLFLPLLKPLIYTKQQEHLVTFMFWICNARKNVLSLSTHFQGIQAADTLASRETLSSTVWIEGLTAWV